MSNTPIVAPLNRESPGVGGVAVTPSDSADLAVVPARFLYVGTSGNLSVVMLNGDSVALTGVSGWVPLSVRRVNATGTTASGIVAFY